MANSRPFRVRQVTTLPARIVAAASSVAFALASQSFHRIWPRLTLTHFEHLVEFRAGFF